MSEAPIFFAVLVCCVLPAIFAFIIGLHETAEGPMGAFAIAMATFLWPLWLPLYGVVRAVKIVWRLFAEEI